MIWKNPSFGQSMCITDNALVLHMEMIQGAFKIVQTARKVQIDNGGSDSAYEIPLDIPITEMEL